MPAQGTTAIIEDRISLIIELLLAGYRRPEIFKFIRTKDELHANGNDENWKPWNVTERQMDKYIVKAKVYVETWYDKNKTTLLNKSVARQENLYKKAYGAKDYRLAKDIIKDMVTLTGLAAPVKNELSGPNGGPIQTKVIINYDTDEE